MGLYQANRAAPATSGRLQGQEVGHAEQAEDLAFDGADAPAPLVVVQPRGHQPDHAASRLQLAAARGQDVLDPVGVGAVGQGEAVAVPGGEDVHRGPVAAAGAPAAVLDHAEAGQPGRDAPGDPVQADLVPAPDRPWDRHDTSLVAAARMPSWWRAGGRRGPARWWPPLAARGG